MLKKIKKDKTAHKKETKTETKKITHKTAKPMAARVKIAKVRPVKPKPVKKTAVKKPQPSSSLPVVEQIKETISPKVILPEEIKEVKVKEVKIKEAKEVKIKEVRIDLPAVKEAIPVVSKDAVAVKETIPEVQPAVASGLKELELNFPVVLKDLAVKLQEKPSNLIKALMGMGMMVGINQVLEENTANAVCEKYGFKIKKALDQEESALEIHQKADKPRELKPRSPIVTLMGHVDHGKTSLLDAIRKSKVAESEHGGITQHIGAYRVFLPKGEITFLDTPGHEAFTAMRARGASITDIVVLVVAADDGVMPQTQEAIDHARAAEVSIIVAINKIDKPQANIERVKKQLSQLDLTPEDWGGKTITVPVSAKSGEGIDNLLEMILLESQMLELKGNVNRLAHGVVIEAKISKGRGPVSTLLVQNGTLHLDDNIIIGPYYGKIRAMFDDHGSSVSEAGVSVAVEVLGIGGVPLAGEQFFAIEDEKTAKDIALRRQEKEKQDKAKTVKRISLEDLHTQIKEGKLKELKIIIKSDVQGSLEAISQTLDKLNISEIKLHIIHGGVGNINTSDVILAVASDALVLGFNVVVDERAKELIGKEGVDAKIYNIIYELANDIKLAIEGMLEPKLKKIFLGRVEIRKVFKLSRSGTVSGCFVSKGRINRNSLVDLLRNGEPLFEGKLSSLKRFKDDVREVAEGFECGITISGFDDVKEGDIIEAYEIEKIARKL